MVLANQTKVKRTRTDVTKVHISKQVCSRAFIVKSPKMKDMLVDPVGFIVSNTKEQVSANGAEFVQHCRGAVACQLWGG